MPTCPRIRFRLRTLLVVLAVLCTPLAWHVNRARNEHWAAARIEALGGSVGFSDDARGWRGGAALFSHVTAVEITLDDPCAVKPFGQFVRYLRMLPRLESLSPGTATTDADFAAIGDLTQLKHLYLDLTGLVDSQVHYLYRMTQLRTLMLPDVYTAAEAARINAVENVSESHREYLTQPAVLELKRHLPNASIFPFPD